MHHGTADKLDLSRRPMQAGQYCLLPSPDGGTWDNF